MLKGNMMTVHGRFLTCNPVGQVAACATIIGPDEQWMIDNTTDGAAVSILNARYDYRSLGTDAAGNVTTHADFPIAGLWRVHSLFNNKHQMYLEFLDKSYNEVRTGWYLKARADGKVYFGEEKDEDAKWVFNDH